MKWFKRICLFIVTMFLLALPTLIFKTDLEFYNSLVGPKIPKEVIKISGYNGPKSIKLKSLSIL